MNEPGESCAQHACMSCSLSVRAAAPRSAGSRRRRGYRDAIPATASATRSAAGHNHREQAARAELVWRMVFDRITSTSDREHPFDAQRERAPPDDIAFDDHRRRLQVINRQLAAAGVERWRRLLRSTLHAGVGHRARRPGDWASLGMTPSEVARQLGGHRPPSGRASPGRAYYRRRRAIGATSGAALQLSARRCAHAGSGDSQRRETPNSPASDESAIRTSTAKTAVHVTDISTGEEERAACSVADTVTYQRQGAPR